MSQVHFSGDEKSKGASVGHVMVINGDGGGLYTMQGGKFGFMGVKTTPGGMDGNEEGGGPARSGVGIPALCEPVGAYQLPLES